MSERWKNAVVGLFVLFGLALVGYLIITFDPAKAGFTRKSMYRIKIEMPSTYDVSVGAVVHMNGIAVGSVEEVEMKAKEDPSQGVWVWARIEAAYKIPNTAEVVVSSQGIGSAYINIPVAPEMKGEAIGDGGAINGRSGGSQLIPESMQKRFGRLEDKFTELVENVKKGGRELKKVTGDFHELFQQRSPDSLGATAEGGEEIFANVSTVVQRLDEALSHVNEVLGDPEARENLKVSLANLRQTSEHARDAAQQFKLAGTKATGMIENINEHVETAASQITDDAAKLAMLFDNMNQVVNEVKAGRGTIGRMIQDQRLYESLLVTSDKLQLLVMEMQDLVSQWKSDGVKFKTF